MPCYLTSWRVACVAFLPVAVQASFASSVRPSTHPLLRRPLTAPSPLPPRPPSHRLCAVPPRQGLLHSPLLPGHELHILGGPLGVWWVELGGGWGMVSGRGGRAAAPKLWGPLGGWWVGCMRGWVQGKVGEPSCRSIGRRPSTSALPGSALLHCPTSHLAPPCPALSPPGCSCGIGAA